MSQNYPEFDIPQFRLRFPEFSDTTVYSDIKLEAFWDMSSVFISLDGSPCRVLTGKQLALALQLMTAHLLSLAVQAASDSATGSAGTGESGGFVVSASVGDISVTKLAPPATDGWQFWLNGSPYGTELWALLGLLAVGGLSYGGLPEREGFRKIGGVFW
ncbi:hypothetical protein KYLE_37 [Pantoea phage Kyle]|uniref:Uncharacterized protein n=1 Tax=Pantoea phage Kyle TaxID=2589665 RepID=A0A514A8K4_9CAUD|nr:virion structural protein [Pantoea phage Kyle]QDH49585.1 hypothetical protein KYLE_37 [Pantoea phage Kyle]